MSARTQTDPRPSRPASPRSTELSIGGMTCQNCGRQVTTALQSVPGVESALVDVETARASVQWKPAGSVDEAALVQAVEKAGFAPSVLPASTSTELIVSGMTCSGCVRSATEALRSVPGVASADVRLEEGRATVLWQPHFPMDEQALLAAVRQAGYQAEPVDPLAQAGGSDWSPLSGWKFNVVFGALVTIPMMVAEWVFRVGMERWYHWAAFLAVIPIQFIGGSRFYRGAWNQLKVGSSNMDTLVALGSTTAFAYSTWGLFSGWHGHLFFMESAAIITLISTGHWVESKVSSRAAASLRALLNLAPETARLIGPNQGEMIVPVAQLRAGDQIVIKPGDRIPTDGAVVEGHSVLDESMLTGESVPVEKRPDSSVYAGTSNLHGWLLVRVTEVGKTTALAQIIAVVQRAQSSRASIQKLGDRVSSVFVPIVILIALATGLWWGLAPASAHQVSDWLGLFLWPSHHPVGPLATAIYHAAAVLIIACPCAMGLATPVAIMAGTNVAAERGILIRDGIALEKTGRLTAVLFDKTGTLTRGRLAITAFVDFLNPAQQAFGFHKLAASLARPSQHPISQAVRAASGVTFEAVEWQEVRGAGVEGRFEITDPELGKTLLRMGSLNWMRETGVDLAPAAEFIRIWSGMGATLLALATDQRLLGMIALRDEVKPAARAVIEQLNAQGKRTYMVTGDNRTTALATAAQVGISPENVFAEIRPEQKAEIVQRLQEKGERVAFIGDGINDAPALEQADLGIAVSQASDVAREAADIILLKSDVQAVPEALALAQATLRTIKQNLFWAFFYNTAGIPLAMFGFLSPILSALAMGLSDLIVIGNALRLRRWKFRTRS